MWKAPTSSLRFWKLLDNLEYSLKLPEAQWRVGEPSTLFFIVMMVGENQYINRFFSPPIIIHFSLVLSDWSDNFSCCSASLQVSCCDHVVFFFWLIFCSFLCSAVLLFSMYIFFSEFLNYYNLVMYIYFVCNTGSFWFPFFLFIF